MRRIGKSLRKAGFVEPLESRTLFTVPTGFAEASWATGLSLPTSMAFAPDGRLFVTEQEGDLRVVGADGSLRQTPFLTFPPDVVRADGERGLLGVALDPNFASNGYVYVYWTNRVPRLHDTVSRFTVNPENPDVALAGSRHDILNLPDNAGGNHMGGALHFAEDGTLYLAVGEHGDPSDAPDLSEPFGKMLRLNSDGSVPSDNPYVDTAGANPYVWAYGLRNPFTFAIEPGTGRMHINDVGSNQFEEVNEGIKGANYGWPETEGKFDEQRFPNYTNPLFAYVRSLDGCAITGGTFYHAPAGAERPWPAEFEGKYLYSDYCRFYVNMLSPGDNFATSKSFAEDMPRGPVDLDIGRSGDLFVLSRGNEAAGQGSVQRISYTASTAPSVGTQPRDQTVSVGQPATFNVTASGSQPLTYQWQRRNAGAAEFVDIDGANSTRYTIEPTSAGDNGAQFRVIVRNEAGTATSSAATLTVTANRPPVAAIDTPPNGTLYRAGETINFSGTGTDPEDGPLPPSAYTWSVVFHHATHTHPFLAPFSGQTSGTFTVPTTGEADADVWYRIHLTVTDSAGLATETFRDVHPRTAQVTLASDPVGISLNLDGSPHTAPYTFTGVAGVSRTLSTPATIVLGGVGYEFVSWSDGGAREHSIVTPDAATAYTATYRVAPVIVGRHVFYNRSAFDGNNPLASAADDGAIATDKAALRPGQTATFANYTSYPRGMNGIMIDLVNGGQPVTGADFVFRVGTSANTSAWAAAPAPLSITRRNGAGANGSDRLTIIWTDRAIKNQWLQVAFQPQGQPVPRDVFYFGNAIGETGDNRADAAVNALDVAGVRSHRVYTRTARIDNPWDVNRDQRVNPLDLAVVRRNLAPPSRSLPLIALAGALDTSTGPFSAVSVLAQGDAEGKILPT